MTCLALADARWATGARDRAHALAEQAQAESSPERRATIDAWLATHALGQ